jgi:hypothetical protein
MQTSPYSNQDPEDDGEQEQQNARRHRSDQEVGHHSFPFVLGAHMQHGEGEQAEKSSRHEAAPR